MKHKVVGIIGGLGPGATLDFFTRVLAKTPAETEADHLHLIIDCNPKVADINRAALGQGPSAEKDLCQMAQNLERAGAGFLVMVCNAGHIYEDAIRRAVSIPFLSLIEETVRETRHGFPAARRVGVLATDGCLKTELYQKALGSHGLDHLVLDREQLKEFMDCIYRIKSGDLGAEAHRGMIQAVERLVEQGADAIIAGCTEIMLVLTPKDLPVPLIDPVDVLAERTVDLGLGRA